MVDSERNAVLSQSVQAAFPGCQPQGVVDRFRRVYDAQYMPAFQANGYQLCERSAIEHQSHPGRGQYWLKHSRSAGYWNHQVHRGGLPEKQQAGYDLLNNFFPLSLGDLIHSTHAGATVRHGYQHLCTSQCLPLASDTTASQVHAPAGAAVVVMVVSSRLTVLPILLLLRVVE